MFLADSVLVSNILDLLFTGGGATAGRTYTDVFLSGVCGFGGSEDDRCRPTVSMASVFPCAEPLLGTRGGSGGVGPGGGRLKFSIVP